jgi:hypothetical protein
MAYICHIYDIYANSIPEDKMKSKKHRLVKKEHFKLTHYPNFGVLDKINITGSNNHSYILPMGRAGVVGESAR